MTKIKRESYEIGEVKVGDKVAFNNLRDATWFEVRKIEGFQLTICEENTNYAEQVMDKSLIKQIRRK